MSFLESIQHGLEKASQEAARITKIQHLHHVADDLSFKASQQGQNLTMKAMEMYHSGILAQGELTAICQQIATYQQQLKEVNEELQRLQKPEDGPAQQSAPVPPPPPPAQAYAAGTIPPGYPAYPAPPPGYPAYPAPTAYPAYPAAPVPPAYPTSPSGEPPTKPGASVAASDSPVATGASTEPPTSPAAASEAGAQAQPAAHKPRHHSTPQEAAPAVDAQANAAPTAGTYANGALPPIFSPFTNNAPAEAESEKPPQAHHAKKAAEGNKAPAPEK